MRKNHQIIVRDITKEKRENYVQMGCICKKNYEVLVYEQKKKCL